MFIVAVRFIDGVLCFLNGCFEFLSRLMENLRTPREAPSRKIDPKPQDLLHPVLWFFGRFFDFAGTPYLGHVDKQRFQQSLLISLRYTLA